MTARPAAGQLASGDDQVTVHCFYNCGHVVRDATPQAAHDAMEAHYRAGHREDVAKDRAFLAGRLS